MIEVLEEGTKKKTVCKKCGAVLSYEMEDVEYSNQYKQYAMGYEDYYVIPVFRTTITCPQCDHKIDV